MKIVKIDSTGFIIIIIKINNISIKNSKALRLKTEKSFMAKYPMLLIISSPTITVRTSIILVVNKVRIENLVIKKSVETMVPAAAGDGSPVNFLYSTELTCTLNLASLNVAPRRYTNTTAHPILPISIKNHLNSRTDGAAPKAIKSDSESYSIPNLELVLVSRATLPSIPSKNIDAIISHPAIQYLPSIELIIE
jgi:hypothetical protein